MTDDGFTSGNSESVIQMGLHRPEDEEVVAIDEAGAPENLREFQDLNDLKLSGKAHKKRLRAKQKERSDEEVNDIVRKLGKAVEGLGTI